MPVIEKDNEFMKDIEQRQSEAFEKGQLWRIHATEFDRAYDLGKRNWNRVMLNYHHFAQTNFTAHNFRDADLDGCVFQNANLRSVSFSHASLAEARFSNCNLSNVGFFSAKMSYARLLNCDLEGVSLDQADLRLAQGIKTVTPVGRSGRLIYAYVNEGEIRIQAGCRNDVPKGIRAAINEDYANDPVNQADYLDAVQLLERWGKREIKRLKTLD